MDPKDGEIVVSAEELAEEQAGAVLPKEEEVRAKVIEDTGFDPNSETDKPKIEKLVAREMDGRKKLQSTIRSKINYRDKLKGIKPPTPPNPPAPQQPAEQDLSSDDVLVLVGAQITHADDIKELKKAAKILGTDIQGALKDPLVAARLREAAEFRRTETAKNAGGGGGGPTGASDQEVLDKAKKGVIPAPGSAEADQLFWARRGGRRK